jgi:GNAT superfamily N-acetyltransferase
MATVFVAKDGERVAGYYALATGGVEAAQAPDRILKGVARHPIPVIILTRLAVAETDKGRGLGRALLGDALRRIDGAAQEIGVRALLVHAKDPSAVNFYMKHGEFEPSPSDDLHLFLLMKDLRKALEA